MHDPREKIPEQNRSEQNGDEVRSAACSIEISRQEAPQKDIDHHPNEERQNPNGAALQEVKLTERNGEGPLEIHALSSSNVSGSRATVMKSSSRLVLPCSAGSVFGFPSRRIFPCERNKTRSQTSVTSYILCEVQRTPT